MKILVIPDVHLKPQMFKQATALMHQGIADRAVCLMDIPDDWDKQYNVGLYEETYDERFLNLIREFDLKGKIISTICEAALPVGKSGVLKNRKATTYHLRDAYRQKQLKEFDVNVVNEPIVVDRNIITSYCPETASGVAPPVEKPVDVLTNVA